MHPSRYGALIDGLTAVSSPVCTGPDQSTALRLVVSPTGSTTGTPVLASGARLSDSSARRCSTGGYRKKYFRAISRLLALTAAGQIGRTIT